MKDEKRDINSKFVASAIIYVTGNPAPVFTIVITDAATHNANKDGINGYLDEGIEKIDGILCAYHKFLNFFKKRKSHSKTMIGS